METKHQIVRSSMVVGIFSFLGSFTGILVESSIAAKLGLSRSSDTFYVAFTIPYIITNLISATGQFSLVPFFASLESHYTAEDSWKGFSYAVNIVFIAMAGAAALGALAAPWLIRAVAPGFAPSEAVHAAKLCRWLFLILLPAGVTEVIRSFLFSRHRFVIPASGNFFRNLTVIASIIATFHRFGLYSIVIGYLAGYLVQLGILGAQLALAFPVRYSLTFAGSGEAFRHLHGAGAAQVGAAIGWQGVVLVERIIASFLPPGTLTALGYGFKIMSTLGEVLAGSVGTAALPTLSKAFARAARKDERDAFHNAIQLALFLVTPAAIFCLLLPHNIIRMVFERGNFTPEATALMSEVFFYYSLGLIFFAVIRMINFYLFARYEAAAFVRLAFLQYGLNVALDLFYVGVLGWGAAGIPLGLLTSMLIVCGAAHARNLGSLRDSLDPRLGRYFLKVLAASALAAPLVWVMRLGMAAPRTGFENFLYLCETCGAGLAVFLITLVALRALKFSQVSALWEGIEG